MSAFSTLISSLQAYKRRYYQNRLLRGVLLTVGLLVGGFLVVAFTEGLGHFGTGVRQGLFFGALGVFAAILGYYFLWPAWQLWQASRLMTDDEAARQVGRHFPDVQDRLLNVLQLSRTAAEADTALLAAALNQKTKQLVVVPFGQAIDLRQNRRFLPLALLPVLLLAGVLVFVPQLLTESTTRLVHYKRVYVPPAPFAFQLENDSLIAVAGIPYQVRVRVVGQALPADVSLVLGTTRLPMQPAGKGAFSYSLGMLQHEQEFVFEAAGIRSQRFRLRVLVPPVFEQFRLTLTPPAYTGHKPEVLEGQGSFSVPEGTRATWLLVSAKAQRAVFLVDSAKPQPISALADGFTITQRLTRSQTYSLGLVAQHLPTVLAGPFRADVVPDLYPRAELNAKPDSADKDLIFLAGSLSDDYGLSRLEIVYRVGANEEALAKATQRIKTLALPAKSKAETFLQTVRLSELGVAQGQAAELSLRVYDNDGVHGPKATTSAPVRFAAPSVAEQSADQAQRAAEATRQLKGSEQRSRQLEKDIKATRDRLVGKRNMNFQDKQALEKLAQQQQALQKDLEQLKEQADKLAKDQEKLNPEQAQEIKEKTEMLQKLLENLLDEDTKKMYDELQKLLNEQTKSDEARDLLEKLQGKEQNLTKELDRALELFKQLTVEKKIDETANRLDELAKEQQKLADEMKQAKNPTDAQKEELAQKQNELSKEFDKLKEDIKALEELNKELQSPEKLPDTKQDQKTTDEAQDQAEQKAKKGDTKKAAEKAQEASDKMEKMAKDIREAQDEGDEEQAEENAEDLRKILENLLHLSFDQERIMGQLREVNQLDPRYLALGQQQVKIKEDAQQVEDSLYALAKRVFAIQPFVTKEVQAMKDNLTEAVDAVKRRRQDIASGKGQLAMTSMNNLALMLSDALKDMQQDMKKKSGGGGKGKKKGKPQPGAGKKPSLSQMQKQLGDQLKQLQKSGKSGRGLSEEVAKMAAQQEAIRRALQDLEKAAGKDGKDQKGEGGSQTGGLKQAMEQQEKDLVNKRVTENMVRRQQEIETRLLEAEKALREREQDTKRESKTAQAQPPRPPADLRAYLKAKQAQTEQLKTQSLPVTPFFKRENERYFKQLQGRAR